MELTTDSLEYIIYVAKEYCYPNKKQLKDCDEIEDAESGAVSIAIDIFQHRYSFIMAEFKEAYDKYLSNDEIQKTLTTYKLNADKFWLLFLFITDFTNSCFSYEEKSPPTTRETVTKISEMLNDAIFIMTEPYTGYTNQNNTFLKLETKEKVVSTDNPLLLHLFNNFCVELLQSENDSLNIVPCWNIEIEEDKTRIRKMTFFVKLFRYFLDEHVGTVKPSKMTFIGKFLYLANIAESEWYYTGFYHTTINKKNQYMIKLHGTITMNGIEYIKEPVDVGKKIADSIKKCTNCTPISTSNYFYVPFSESAN